MATALRSDAQRNLDRVLEAAAEAFAANGPDVSVDEIARLAGVGHATVFRRFPTKDALIAAVVDKRVQELVADAEAAAAADDVGAAYEQFLLHIAEAQARDRRLFECFGRCAESAALTRLHEIGADMVTRAQAAGALRSDVTPHDVERLFQAVLGAAPAGSALLYARVVLDGLRR
jgi:AcrR family transcriptional regulator